LERTSGLVGAHGRQGTKHASYRIASVSKTLCILVAKVETVILS